MIQVKYILVNIAFFIYLMRICAFGGLSLDIVLSINESGNNYTKFINLTNDTLTWLSSVLCNKDTYKYSISYDDTSGSVVTNSSETFRQTANIDTSIYLKEFICINSGKSFGCTRMANNTPACTHIFTWIYLDVNTSLTCSDRCISLCPLYPIESIFIEQSETLNDRTVECQIPNYEQSTPGKTDLKNLSTSTTGIRLISSTTVVLPEKSKSPSTSSCSSNSCNRKETSDDFLPVILGASIGGGLCIIIVLIVIVVCIRKRRKRDHPRKLVTSENNLNFENDNALDNKLHNHIVSEEYLKKCDSTVKKLEVKQQVSEKNNAIRSILDRKNVNTDNLTYSVIGKDIAKNYVGELNESNHGYSQNTFSNPVFHGLDADYSCTNDIQDKNNNSEENDDGKASNLSSSNNSPENTYSTLGEKTRSYSETYNMIPMGMNRKKINNAPGDQNDNISCAPHRISKDSYSKEDGVSNEVYAQVNKAKRVTN